MRRVAACSGASLCPSGRPTLGFGSLLRLGSGPSPGPCQGTPLSLWAPSQKMWGCSRQSGGIWPAAGHIPRDPAVSLPAPSDLRFTVHGGWTSLGLIVIESSHCHLIVRCSMVTPDSGRGSLGPLRGHVTLGRLFPTPGGAPGLGRGRAGRAGPSVAPEQCTGLGAEQR